MSRSVCWSTIVIVGLIGLPALACDAPVANGLSDAVMAKRHCVALLHDVRAIGMRAMEHCKDADTSIASSHGARTVAVEPVPASTAGPPPPPLPPASDFDAAWCALLVPSSQALDRCLVDAITDTSVRDDPRCPRFAEHIALGDLAFFALSERHPGLWKALVPEDPERGAIAFQGWIEPPGRRERLQADVRERLFQVPQPR